MLLTLLKGKIHRAVVTDSNVEYAGSIAIDRSLMKESGIIPNERVDIYNITNGERFTTYAIEASDGVIGVKGAAAHKAKAGDIIIICAYAQMTEDEAASYKPSLVFVDKNNKKKNG